MVQVQPKDDKAKSRKRKSNNKSKIRSIVPMAAENNILEAQVEQPEVVETKPTESYQLTEQDVQGLLVVTEESAEGGQSRLGFVSKEVAEKFSEQLNVQRSIAFEEGKAHLKDIVEACTEAFLNIKDYYTQNDIKNVQFWNIRKLVQFAKYVMSQIDDVLDQIKEEIGEIKQKRLTRKERKELAK